MLQTWNDLLFAHWPIEPAELRSRMPRAFEPETFEGQAWVGVVPFWMSGVRPRFVPPLPGLSSFPELNVRTYVSIDGKPGVYFFSLDAGNRIAVDAARFWFHLPYFKARMEVRREGETIHYASHRTDRRGYPADLAGWYRPVGPIFRTEPGTLEQWLVERYALYTTDRTGRVYRADILHNPWLLQTAEADFPVQTMLASHGIAPFDQPPLLHFSRKIEMIAWHPARLR